jgi:site-specific recombinase XerD
MRRYALIATRALADGFTISEVQRLMRHPRLETTAVYLEVRDVDLRAKVRARR